MIGQLAAFGSMTAQPAPRDHLKLIGIRTTPLGQSKRLVLEREKQGVRPCCSIPCPVDGCHPGPAATSVLVSHPPDEPGNCSRGLFGANTVVAELFHGTRDCVLKLPCLTSDPAGEREGTGEPQKRVVRVGL